ncbi:GapA-binding peptide SR1P [Paenibacillus albicereus]|uniref:GapA-binding peptide SR1P n=1 Tax=Paenibacillus albicereus TaxID=2726185 RepID=A0A6H2H285_9BACL|nr:GapA-binding peptide SR1P [Paenibacillus albicereus]QJC53709.1 GapA-binding peptide SR1P [Paenibacillus albicereus]
MKTGQSAAAGSLHYGLVLCPSCNEIIDTLPTNRVKIFHSLCDSPACREAAARSAGLGFAPPASGAAGEGERP